MAAHLTYKDTKEQSLQVFGQFGPKWIEIAKENVQLKRSDTAELQNVGLGKTLVLVAMGASLEENIDTLKKYRDRIDILCCDKAFVPLMDRGIKPDYVMICDANIPARYYETHVLETQGIRLLATPYANTLWTKPWRGPRYFFVNKDAIGTEKHFLNIFGENTRVVPAGSNVSNAMLIFMVGVDELSRVNWAGYERYLLVGYDYSWRPDGNYYAWLDVKPKRHYMHHLTLPRDIGGTTAFTSGNLYFSVKWLTDYVTIHKLPVVNCSGRGLLQIPRMDRLENQLKMVSSDKRRSESVRQAYRLLQNATMAQMQAQNNFNRTREELLWQSEAAQN